MLIQNVVDIHVDTRYNEYNKVRHSCCKDTPIQTMYLSLAQEAIVLKTNNIETYVCEYIEL